jgi:hypothetical protein
MLAMTKAGSKEMKVGEFVNSKGSQRSLGLTKRARDRKEKADVKSA